MAKARWTLFDSFKQQAYVLVPIFLSAVLLIGLIVYSWIEGEGLSKETKDTIMYTELALSFVVSIHILMLFFVLLMAGHLNLILLLFFLLSPVALTLGRIILKNYSPNEQVDIGVSVITILSTIYSCLMIFGFAFRGLIDKPWF
jgi:hypothetical protein